MAKKNDNKFGTIEMVKKTGLSAERLRYWERAGIVCPIYMQHNTRKFRRFSRKDIDRALLVKRLVDDDKYTLEGAINKLNGGG
jgi:DNA-binding transcriptional MerR regulator